MRAYLSAVRQTHSARQQLVQDADQANVELVTDGIDHFAPEGVVSTDGRLRQHDIIVISTGFKVSEMAARPQHHRA